ncbi:TolC family protein [Granulosicoccus antarcticus]|uniref:Outer membrane protein TolC n=1 Tax=Granulosicoccus antarcticus IMCC3135 TaxID=1192854 RepID=A0A2Z2NP69_9GAMM|nr:TolC family protein [Granulosicoccus antarcticus]ASJ73049.1 hypothetical protein IMCC3135_14820 [Granulosicoccus antarcticus IMCC3135]
MSLSNPEHRATRLKLPLKASVIAAALALSGCNTTLHIMDSETIDSRASVDFEQLFANVPAPGEIMSLAEAVARAIKYNLDHRVAMMNSVVAQRHLDLSDYNKLPRLAASAGYTARDKVHASSSFNLATGVPNFGASTSQDKSIVNADLELSWNTLDFGIAWIESRQAGNAALIAVEQQRRITANIVRDVRDAYWRLVSAERLAPQLAVLKKDIQQGLNDSYAAQRAKLKPLEECLEEQRTLLDLQRQVLQLQRGIAESRSVLASLIGLPPGSWFTVDVEGELFTSYNADAALDRNALQQIALRHRPELIEEDYQSRIAADEVNKARIRWIPGIELFTGTHYSDNSYLLHSAWAASGVRLTWNLLSVFSAPAATRLAKSKQELGELRRLALSMAVLTQVDVALQRLQQSKEDYRLASQMTQVDRSTIEQYERRASASRIDRQTVLQARARDVVSRLRYTIAYGEWQSATASVYSSIGYEPAVIFDHDAPLEQIIAAVEDHLENSTYQGPRGLYEPEESRRRSRQASDYDAHIGDTDALSTPGDAR